MHTTLTPAEWLEIERIMVSTGSPAEVADLLVRYREGSMTLAELVSAIRELCAFGRATQGTHGVELPTPGSPAAVRDPA